MKLLILPVCAHAAAEFTQVLNPILSDDCMPELKSREPHLMSIDWKTDRVKPTWVIWPDSGSVSITRTDRVMDYSSDHLSKFARYRPTIIASAIIRENISHFPHINPRQAQAILRMKYPLTGRSVSIAEKYIDFEIGINLYDLWSSVDEYKQSQDLCKNTLLSS